MAAGCGLCSAPLVSPAQYDAGLCEAHGAERMLWRRVELLGAVRTAYLVAPPLTDLECDAMRSEWDRRYARELLREPLQIVKVSWPARGVLA